MGILSEPIAYVSALPLRKPFTVCELGDQWVTSELPHRLARDFYQSIGCGRYESIDGNGRGTTIHDLNRKWHAVAFGTFDLVTDFGTGEHVFNQAEVWRTIHVLTNKGGYIVFDHPTVGYEGHGFYRIDACLYPVLAEANRYTVIKLDRTTTTRGELVRGVFQKTQETKFQAPQQGRYQKALQV